jgi:hypothetical protein
MSLLFQIIKAVIILILIGITCGLFIGLLPLLIAKKPISEKGFI